MSCPTATETRESPRRLRLVYVTSSFPFSRSEAFLIPEVLELRRRGHAVRVVPVFPRGRLVHADAAELLGDTVRAPLLSHRILAAAAAEARRDTSSVLSSLRVLLESRSARILAKNLLVSAKGVWLARLARSFGADHIHAHWGATSSTIAMLASRVSGIPWSMTVHRWDIREDNLLDAKVASAEFVRAISETGRQAVVATAPAARARAPFVLHMGVPLPLDLAPVSPPSADRPFRILVAANLLPIKGHVHLIDALALLRQRGRNVVVELAGEGPLRRRLERRAAARGVASECRFLGQLSHAELLRRLASGTWDASALTSIVMPSGETEGLPVSLIEAMSHGVPVIGSDVGGISELLAGGAGAVVPPADAHALADAVERLLDQPDELARLRTAGRRRIEEEFAVERVVDVLVEQFERTTAERLRLRDPEPLVT